MLGGLKSGNLFRSSPQAQHPPKIGCTFPPRDPLFAMDSEYCKRFISYPHVSLKTQSAHDVALEEFNPVPPVKLSCQSIGRTQITESAYNADITPNGGVCSVPLVLSAVIARLSHHWLALIDFLTIYSNSFLPIHCHLLQRPFPTIHRHHATSPKPTSRSLRQGRPARLILLYRVHGGLRRSPLRSTKFSKRRNPTSPVRALPGTLVSRGPPCPEKFALVV